MGVAHRLLGTKHGVFRDYDMYLPFISSWDVKKTRQWLKMILRRKMWFLLLPERGSMIYIYCVFLHFLPVEWSYLCKYLVWTLFLLKFLWVDLRHSKNKGSDSKQIEIQEYSQPNVISISIIVIWCIQKIFWKTTVMNYILNYVISSNCTEQQILFGSQNGKKYMMHSGCFVYRET